ncbi:MAG: PCRF domain-containing protein [Selenomonas sp.]|nr:PCRF domain-containing protein [Selenomonas sp.]
MMDKLHAVVDKFLEFESLISDPSVIEDMNRWQRYNKEHANLQPIIEAYREYKKVCQGIEDNKEMLDEGIEDDEFRHMVEDELADFRRRKDELDQQESRRRYIRIRHSTSVSINVCRCLCMPTT